MKKLVCRLELFLAGRTTDDDHSGTALRNGGWVANEGIPQGWPALMEKFCVFCGEFPENKNKEHVIPEWLIKLTGDPNRTAMFGIDFSKQKLSYRQFSFDALTFPACTNCNNDFSKLETITQPIVRALLERRGVTAAELIILLDWLDKVRVGLWLGYFYLNKNRAGINPTFHISNRLGRSDRMVAVFQIADFEDGLNFLGPESGFYQLSPTCFWLRVNRLCLINASGIALCSRRLGFPFLHPYRYRDDRQLEIAYEHGSGRVMYPVERGRLLPNAAHLYQPVFRQFLETANGKPFLETDWVTAHTADFERGYGRLFLQKEGSVRLYPDGESSDWIPSETWQMWDAVNDLPEYIYQRLYDDFVSVIPITSSKNYRKHMRQQATMLRMMDRALVLKSRETASALRRST